MFIPLFFCNFLFGIFPNTFLNLFIYLFVLNIFIVGMTLEQ